jgi:hypothetical protein
MNRPMSNKSPEVKSLIESLFPGTQKAIDNKICPCCHSKITDFKNAISYNEYLISGWCQHCQDNVFG